MLEGVLTIQPYFLHAGMVTSCDHYPVPIMME